MLTKRSVLLIVVALGLAAVFVRLGIWQLSRHAQRSAANAAREARAAEPALDWTAGEPLPSDTAGLVWRHVSVRGRYDRNGEVVLRGRSLGGRPGVEIATPLRVGDETVLVIRGWLPAPDALRADLESGWPSRAADREPSEALADAAAGAVEIEGVLVPPAGGRGGQPLSVASNGREHLALAGADLDVISEWLGVSLSPYVIRARRGSAGAAILEQPPAPEPGAGPHLSYAIQWFAFAAIALGGTAILVRKEGRE